MDDLVHRGAGDAHVVRRRSCTSGRRTRIGTGWSRRGAVLDTAAMRLAVLDMPWTPNAPLCIRSGFVALREIAGYFGFDYDDDPEPDDPISVTREEFDEVLRPARRRRASAQGRPRAGVARLRGLARQLRRGAAHAGRDGYGSVRAVDLGSLAGDADASLRVGAAAAGVVAAGEFAAHALTSHARIEVDAGDRVHRADRVEHLERVVRALQLDVDDRLGARRPQLLDERARFVRSARACRGRRARSARAGRRRVCA